MMTDLPDEIYQQVQEGSSKILDNLRKCNDSRVGATILVSVITNYVYEFEGSRGLFDKIGASVALTLDKWLSEDS